MHNNEHNPLKLSADERESMKRTFSAYMDMHPVQEPGRIPSPYFFSFARFPAYAFFAMIFILSGTAYAAELSLPNDPLYPVKTRVIEPVFIKAPALSKHSKARASSSLTVRRLKEAESLADRRELNAELAAYLEAEIEEHANAVQAYVAEASQAGELEEALTVSTELETSLEAHSEVLESVDEEDGVEDAALQGLLENIEEELAEAASTGDRIELDTITSASDEAVEFLKSSRTEVEKSLNKLRKEDVSLSASEEELVEEARDLLSEAEKNYSRISEAEASGNTKEAVEGARDALRAAKRATILMDSLEELGAE